MREAPFRRADRMKIPSLVLLLLILLPGARAGEPDAEDCSERPEGYVQLEPAETACRHTLASYAAQTDWLKADASLCDSGMYGYFIAYWKESALIRDSLSKVDHRVLPGWKDELEGTEEGARLKQEWQADDFEDKVVAIWNRRTPEDGPQGWSDKTKARFFGIAIQGYDGDQKALAKLEDAFGRACRAYQDFSSVRTNAAINGYRAASRAFKMARADVTEKVLSRLSAFAEPKKLDGLPSFFDDKVGDWDRAVQAELAAHAPSAGTGAGGSAGAKGKALEAGVGRFKEGSTFDVADSPAGKVPEGSGAGVGAGPAAGAAGSVSDMTESQRDGAFSSRFGAVMEGQIGKTQAGRDLLAATPSAPAIVITRDTREEGGQVKDNDGTYATYSSKSNTIKLNSVLLAPLVAYVDPDAAQGRDLKDPQVLRDYLLEHPETMRKLADKADVTYFHERTHALQHFRNPTEGEVVGGLYASEHEQEAFDRENFYLSQKIAFDPAVAKARDPWSKTDLDEYWSWTADRKAYLDSKNQLYREKSLPVTELARKQGEEIDRTKGLEGDDASRREDCLASWSAKLDYFTGKKAECEKQFKEAEDARTAQLAKLEQGRSYLDRDKTLLRAGESERGKAWARASFDENLRLADESAVPGGNIEYAVDRLFDAGGRAADGGFLSDSLPAVQRTAKKIRQAELDKLQGLKSAGQWTFDPKDVGARIRLNMALHELRQVADMSRTFGILPDPPELVALARDLVAASKGAGP